MNVPMGVLEHAHRYIHGARNGAIVATAAPFTPSVPPVPDPGAGAGPEGQTWVVPVSGGGLSGFASRGKNWPAGPAWGPA
jgi:hypothetical protein